MTGKDILGCGYSASCETLRKGMKSVKEPKVADCIFFSGTRHSGANHIGIVYKVDSSKVYTIEGNTSGGSTVVDNGGGVAKKSYAKSYNRILGYGRPAFTKEFTAADLIKIAEAEVGYLEKKSASNEDSKTANAGSNNYTKYGKWLGMDGQYWCAAFVSWCFSQLGLGAVPKTTTKTSTSTKKAYEGVIPNIIISNGYTGTSVKYLQKFLNWYASFKLTVDGDCGAKTVAAIKTFEKNEGLVVDGIWGNKCYTKACSIKK